MEKYICPVCGFGGLDIDPYSFKKNLCPCCGYEFDILGPQFEEYRCAWLSRGARWADSKQKPENWDLIKQMNNLQNFVFETFRWRGVEWFEFHFAEKENLDEIDIDSIKSWPEDSLYTRLINPLFKKYYYHLLLDALLNNGEYGFDKENINYYSPQKTIEFRGKVQQDETLPDRQVLLAWLDEAIKRGNGFYILAD